MKPAHREQIHAEIELPAWLGGGDPRRFLLDSGLTAEPINETRGLWRISNTVSWDRGRQILVTIDDIAGTWLERLRFDLLPNIIRAEAFSPPIPSKVVEEVNRMGKLANQSKDPVSSLSWIQMATMTIPATQLEDWLKRTYENFIQIGMQENPDDKVFANAGVHVVRRSPMLLHRAKLASVSMQLSSDNSFSQKTLEQIQLEANEHNETIFASSEGLYDGIYTLDSYLSPLYGSLVPAVWAFPASRMLGVVIFSLGQPLAGSQGRATELLHLLPSQGPSESSDIPRIDPMASREAIGWWVRRLNDLLTILSDPIVFADSSGKYNARSNLHAQLTVEQLFRRIFSMQASLRDSQARRVLFFSALDTLERLTAHNIEVLCDLGHAKSTLKQLRASMPSRAAEVLLPGAERGVTALEGLQKGFFIGRRLGTDRVEWTDPDRGVQSLTVDTAAAKYIRLLRDATHGHGTKGGKGRERTDALLTHHNGKIPHDLGWLGYLYLLDLLLQPENLRRRLRHAKN